MRILAIDPGMKGGLCFREKTAWGEVNYKLYPMPIDGGLVDVGKIQEWIIEYRPQQAVIETQRSQSGQGNQHKIGINYGRLTAVLDLCEIETFEMTPQKWQKILGLTGDKQSHIDYAQDTGYEIPALTPKGDKRHDGIADACCIAEAWVIDTQPAAVLS